MYQRYLFADFFVPLHRLVQWTEQHSYEMLDSGSNPEPLT